MELVKDPTTSTPSRVPGSARRASYVDMIWLPAAGFEASAESRLVVRAAARDIATGADGGGTVLDEATLTAWIGDRNQILRLEVDAAGAALDGVDSLLGRVAGRGFRAAAREVAGERWAEPVGLLLDDLPVAVLIAGYGQLVAGKVRGAPDHMRDLCSGWRSDGTMIRAIDAGEPFPVPGVAPAPDLSRADDPLAVQPTLPLPLGALRRRRRVDLLPGEPAPVDATFRDTYQTPDGEGVLHEYIVRTTFGSSGALGDVSAEPRVLPWIECPAAAAHAARVSGALASDLARLVPTALTGLSSCTHLNDLLRSLTCLPRLRDLRPRL
jgi:hypothetical protein